ncbi:glycosyltransferase [Pelagicoccus albus]|uniref:Glycosyltransferase family 2 protein n=1 Tax=Pelagicoccus albus TaxID=415222 RepID=A0A7X1B8C7_9BACT|nr:glycosyltransferase family 2 protein [Pelagicoccus albus]MBC2606283.1 glycosyltransferase family 2 protein [Pelagicoccus albus]
MKNSTAHSDTYFDGSDTPFCDTTKISVVIVNYFKGNQVVECVGSLRKQSISHCFEYVVLDNSVSQSEKEVLLQGLGSDVKTIFPCRNLGYSKGVNAAVKCCRTPSHVLLVNPDIVVPSEQAIETMLTEMLGDDRIGVLGTLQRNPNGEVVEVARRFPSFHKLFARRLFPGSYMDSHLLEPLLGENPIDRVEVDWVQSSFTLVRDSLWHGVGGLNERYYIFMADVDLGKRAVDSGYKVVVTSSVIVFADGLRASRGGIKSIFKSRALRVHVLDAVKYFVSAWIPERICERRTSLVVSQNS